MECNLKKIRKEKGLSFYQLSKIMNRSPQQIHAYEKYGIAPGVEVALQMAKALDCKVEDIYKLN